MDKNTRKELEDYEPGASKEEVMAALGKTATYEDKKEDSKRAER